MTYEPQEGVDYLIDLYAVANVAENIEQDELKQALNDRIKEYHPDRLLGLAPEFQAKGERMARLLNRAKGILLDPEKRREYDEILTDWDGPLSNDGTPVITVGRNMRAEAALKTPEEIEASIASDIPQIESMTGYSASQLSFLEKMVEQAGADVPDDLREAYENALLSQDRALAIEEANRGDLLSLPSMAGTKYVATLDYADSKIKAIETARKVHKDELVSLALGWTTTRLALLAGESIPEPTGNSLVSPESIQLPAYFDEQAKKIQEIAEKRQAIVEKRLNNFKPTYPEAELQTEAQPAAVLGVAGTSWYGFTVNAETCNVDFMDVPEAIRELLDAKNYAAVIESGFNVITFELMDQISVHEQLEVALNHYVEKYNLLPEED